MNDSIVIRGTGLITPVGGSADSTFAGLLAGAFIRDHARCDCPGGSASRSTDVSDSRVSRLARIATNEAVAASGWTDMQLGDSRTALLVGTSRGPADDWAESNANIVMGDYPAKADVISPLAFGLSSVADDLARHVGHGRGPRLTYSGACASGLQALIRAVMLLAHDDADRALVVAAESSLHPLFLQSFRRLGVLPAAGGRCRPFDVERSGFLCAEAAAAVVLERVAVPAVGDVMIDGFALAGDASHLTGSDPSGSTLRRVLAQAIDGRPIDLIHAHGTGTIANDAAEADAIDAVLSGQTFHSPPVVYSHKGAIGHTVGAAGLVSIVLNALMHQRSVIPPNIGVRTPIPIRHAVIHLPAVERRIQRSVSVAAGFGGATAAVSLATAEPQTG